MEFEAETWWFYSTHEYYKTTKFQLQTPSLSAPTRNTSCPERSGAPGEGGGLQANFLPGRAALMLAGSLEA